MNFAQWYFENGPDPKQQLFPWMSQEEPLDWKQMTRYKSPENYIKAQVKGARKTEGAAKEVVAAPPNGWLSGPEQVENIYNSEFVMPARQLPSGQMWPEKHVAFVVLNKTDPLVNGNKRLLALYQGDPNHKVNKADVIENLYNIIGGIVFKGPYLTHAWVDPSWKAPGVNLYKSLRDFARQYYGVVGVEPGDELTSKSYRTAQAKYDWKRFQQWKQEQQPTS